MVDVLAEFTPYERHSARFRYGSVDLRSVLPIVLTFDVDLGLALAEPTQDRLAQKIGSGAASDDLSVKRNTTFVFVEADVRHPPGDDERLKIPRVTVSFSDLRHGMIWAPNMQANGW
jgi:hypothetical protein